MVRLLSLALSASAVSSTFAYQNLDEVLKNIKVNSHQQVPPDVVGRISNRNANTCIGSGWEIRGLDRFTAIFFGDFYTGGSKDISGPLAVEGDFHAPGYSINANGGSDPDDEDSLDYYGLIVGGTTNTMNTRVHGSAYLAEGGTVDNVDALDGGCVHTDKEADCLFDFAATKNFLVQASIDFAGLDPTLRLDPDRTLTNLRECGEDSYEVLTFNSCGKELCSASSDSESYPSNMLFGRDNWNGIKGSTIDRSKTYILNIPVMNGKTIVLDTDSPSHGFNPCNTIYNIYPIDERGEYCAEGEVTVVRKTANQLGGFILAPKVHIVDGSCGNFAGTVVGLSYTWENLDAGVEIHDYNAAGGLCDYYTGCTPAEGILSKPTCPVTNFMTKTKTDTRTMIMTNFRTLTNSHITTETDSRTSTVTSISTTTTTTTTVEQTTTTSVSLETISFKEIETTCDITDPVTTITQSITGPITTVTKTIAAPVNDAARPVTTFTQIIAGPTTTVIQTFSEPINDAAMVRPAVTITLTSIKFVPTLVPITKTVTDCPIIAPANDLDKYPRGPGEEYNQEDDYNKYHRGHHHGPGEECKEGIYTTEDDYKNHLGHHHGPGEECNEGSYIQVEDFIKNHLGHHHGPGEQCNEGSYSKDDDYIKNHLGHHHGPGEECNEDNYNKNEDYIKNHLGHQHGPGEECNEGSYSKDDDDEDD